MLAFVYSKRRQMFVYSYNPITIMLSTHSAERPLLHLSFSRAGEQFSNTIWQGYQKDSGSCYLGLHFLSIRGYSREQVPLCKAALLWCSNITSHLINTFPPLWKMEWGGFSEKGLERNESNERREDKGKATQDLKKKTKKKLKKHKKGIW